MLKAANIQTVISPSVSSDKSRQLLRLSDANVISRLKKGIWFYFILLIFEGALRKWVLPGFASPLLIVRDPIAIWLIVTAWRHGVLTPNLYLTTMLLVGVLGTFTAVLLGHGNFFVALFGARIIIVHFPIIFIVGKIFDKDDVLKLGKFMLLLSIPMTVLLVLQFYSPQSAWVNRGIGGDTESSGFSGALGFFRAPTTFSFTNGTALFYSFLGCFVLYFWISSVTYITKPLLITSSIALLMSVPFSISRSLFFSLLITLLFVLIALLKNRKSLGRVLIAVVSISVLILMLSQISIFQTAIGAFTARFTDASDIEGGLQGTLLDRFLGSLIGSVSSINEVPFFGYGLGSYTNAGHQLLVGNVVAATAEQEWGRLIAELGMIMGLIVIIIRIALTLKIGKECFRLLSKNNLLPWILFSNCCLQLLQGQWSQATSLGFCVFVTGITISSMRLLNNTQRPY